MDILVLGMAKAGALCVDVMVLFDRSLARRLNNRLKQAGQVASKARFLSAPALGLLESDAWEGHAAHANRMAQRLARRIAEQTPFELGHPVDANAVFVKMSAAAHRQVVQAGWACHRFDDGSARFVCSWATREEAVDALAEALTEAAKAG